MKSIIAILVAGIAVTIMLFSFVWYLCSLEDNEIAAAAAAARAAKKTHTPKIVKLADELNAAFKANNIDVKAVVVKD